MVEEREHWLLVLVVPDFAAVDSNRGNKALEMFRLVAQHHGGGWLAVKVVMVIMTSIGMPTGYAHSHSTGKIIFVLVLVGQVHSGIVSVQLKIYTFDFERLISLSLNVVYVQ